MFGVDISSMSPERVRSVLTAGRFEAFERGVRDARELLAGRVVWNINSTARGGGVAELLESLVAYARGAGVDVRWVVIGGTPDFFAVTKRFHNRSHGAMGDGGALDDEARPVVASGIGGIRSQNIDGESGILLDYLRVIRQILARPGVRTAA